MQIPRLGKKSQQHFTLFLNTAPHPEACALSPCSEKQETEYVGKTSKNIRSGIEGKSKLKSVLEVRPNDSHLIVRALEKESQAE